MDVTTPGGMERDQEGFKSAVRVRLMHSQVRAMLLQSDKWNMAWGHPLNQWDSMATILEFSVIFLTGLRSLGFIFSKKEREAVVHLWRYVGYLMGVEERILPTCEPVTPVIFWATKPAINWACRARQPSMCGLPRFPCVWGLNWCARAYPGLTGYWYGWVPKLAGSSSRSGCSG